jgi:hypothetical protein
LAPDQTAGFALPHEMDTAIYPALHREVHMTPKLEGVMKNLEAMVDLHRINKLLAEHLLAND